METNGGSEGPLTDGNDGTPTTWGEGPETRNRWSFKPYHHPAAGWGAAKSVAEVLVKAHGVIEAPRVMLKMNQEDGGFDCPGCAWPDAIDGLKLDLCENGVKHVAWEMRKERVGREFFARHTVADLSTWTAGELEAQCRLVEPMSYDPASDTDVPLSWDDALALFCQHVGRLGSSDR